jgi:hypothetical protein
MAASLLIGPHIEMSTLCDGSLLYCSTVSSIHVYVLSTVITLISLHSSRLSLAVVAVQNRSPKADTRHVGT